MSEQIKRDTAVKYGAGAVASIAGLKALGGAGILKMAITLFISLGLYAFVYGWGYAAVVILLILIHEMGHWLYMKVKGLKPKSPIFLPFVGAFVAMSELAPDEATDAWVAFWGPFMGGLGTLLVYAIGVITRNGTLMAGGSFGFFLNLLQLVPIKPLDGGFIAGALSKWLIVPGAIIALAVGFILRAPLLLAFGAIPIISLIFNRKPKPDAEKPISQATAGQAPPAVADAAAAVPEANPAAVQKKPATPKQRIAIGLAYVSLALFLGIMQFVVAYQLQTNKDFAQGQIACLNEQIKHSNDIDLYRDRSQYNEVLGRIANAESDIQRVIDHGDGETDDYLALVRFRFAQGHLDAKAGQALDIALSKCDPKSQDAWTIAYAYLLGNEYSHALDAAKSCDEAVANDIKSFVFARTGKLKEAHACSELAMKDPPSELYAFCRKSLMEISEDELPEAKVDLDEVRANDPDDPLATLMFGWYALYTKDPKAAIAYADRSMHKLDDPAIDNMDKFHIITASHRLKAGAYEKLDEAAMSGLEKEHLEKQASSEMAAYRARLGFDLYVPAAIVEKDKVAAKSKQT